FGPRLCCRDLGHDQRDRRVPDHRPHAEDVPQEGCPFGGGEKVSNGELFLQGTYLIASILFLMGLRSLSPPDTARRGMIMAAAGMAAAVIGTLFHPDIHNYLYIAIGLILGSAIGIPMAMVPMTAMPQRTALSHAFGALAASMVGIAEYVIH